jgi:hypothetical protein
MHRSDRPNFRLSQSGMSRNCMPFRSTPGRIEATMKTPERPEGPEFHGHSIRQSAWFRQNIDFFRAMLLAIGVWAILQVPLVDRTFLWEPDRQMLATAFKLRQGVVEVNAPPVAWIEVGDGPLNSTLAAPPAVVSRKQVETALRYARGSRAAAVILDIDLAFQDGDPAANAALASELERWATAKDAPPLLLVRELMPESGVYHLPPTPFDNIVAGSARIEWVSANLCVDERQQVRSIPGPQSYVTADTTPGIMPGVVDATLSFTGAEVPDLAASADPCSLKATFDEPRPHERLIDWHIGANAAGSRGESGAPAVVDMSGNPRVSSDWTGIKACGLSEAPYALKPLPGQDIPQDDGPVDTSKLCGAIVIIGADSALHPDNAWTPLGVMSGPLILANAIRGSLAGGVTITRRDSLSSLLFQLAILALFVFVTFRGFALVESIRTLLRRPTKGRSRGGLSRLALWLTNPLVMKFLFSIAAFWLGAALTAFTLKWGLWGALSAPTYIAALTGAGALMSREAGNRSGE